jgi:hypothetical protein
MLEKFWGVNLLENCHSEGGKRSVDVRLRLILERQVVRIGSGLK